MKRNVQCLVLVQANDPLDSADRLMLLSRCLVYGPHNVYVVFLLCENPALLYWPRCFLGQPWAGTYMLWYLFLLGQVLLFVPSMS